jgi:hypothetical protein
MECLVEIEKAALQAVVVQYLFVSFGCEGSGAQGW